MSSEVSSCTVESAVTSGLDFEETELKLAPPGRADGEKKRGFAETVEWKIDARPSAEKAVAQRKAPAAKAQVVGWPPVRSTWKKAMNSCKYVKVAVDGTPYLRKVNLEIYGSYQQLLTALEEMFSCFSIRNYLDERRLVDSMNGTEYVPTYEDKEGDWMLVGDVPWKMFVDSCRRLRLMKSSDAVNLAAPRTPQRSSNAE